MFHIILAAFSFPNTFESPVPILVHPSPESAHPTEIWALLCLPIVPVSPREPPNASSEKQAPQAEAGSLRSAAAGAHWPGRPNAQSSPFEGTGTCTPRQHWGSPEHPCIRLSLGGQTASESFHSLQTQVLCTRLQRDGGK